MENFHGRPSLRPASDSRAVPESSANLEFARRDNDRIPFTPRRTERKNVTDSTFFPMCDKAHPPDNFPSNSFHRGFLPSPPSPRQIAIPVAFGNSTCQTVIGTHHPPPFNVVFTIFPRQLMTKISIDAFYSSRNLFFIGSLSNQLYKEKAYHRSEDLDPSSKQTRNLL